MHRVHRSILERANNRSVTAYLVNEQTTVRSELEPGLQLSGQIPRARPSCGDDSSADESYRARDPRESVRQFPSRIVQADGSTVPLDARRSVDLPPASRVPSG